MTAKLIAEQRWMRVEEAAVYARVGISYVRKLIRTRRLPAIDTGRYYVIDRFKLDACLESLEEPKPRATNRAGGHFTKPRTALCSRQS